MSKNKIEDIYNFLKLSDKIATSGQPTQEQFHAIKGAGYQVIVNYNYLASNIPTVRVIRRWILPKLNRKR
jgi:hypothetical protein